MAVSKLNENIQDQIYVLLEDLQHVEKVKNKDIPILLVKIVRQYGEKVVNKSNNHYSNLLFSCFSN